MLLYLILFHWKHFLPRVCSRTVSWSRLLSSISETSCSPELLVETFHPVQLRTGSVGAQEGGVWWKRWSNIAGRGGPGDVDVMEIKGTGRSWHCWSWQWRQFIDIPELKPDIRRWLFTVWAGIFIIVVVHRVLSLPGKCLIQNCQQTAFNLLPWRGEGIPRWC